MAVKKHFKKVKGKILRIKTKRRGLRHDVSTHHTGSWVRWTPQDSHRAAWIPPDNGRRWSKRRSCTRLHTFVSTRRVVEKDRKGREKKKTLVIEAKTPGPCHKMSTCTVWSSELFLSKPYHQSVHSWPKRNFDGPPFTLTNERGIWHLAPFEQTKQALEPRERNVQTPFLLSQCLKVPYYVNFTSPVFSNDHMSL